MTARVHAWFLSCDEAFCERTFIESGGGANLVIPLRRAAADWGWSRRNGWDLCPDHGTPSERSRALAIQREAREVAGYDGQPGAWIVDGFVITPEQEHILLRQADPMRNGGMNVGPPDRSLTLMHVLYGKPVIVTDSETIPPRYHDLRGIRP